MVFSPDFFIAAQPTPALHRARSLSLDNLRIFQRRVWFTGAKRWAFSELHRFGGACSPRACSPRNGCQMLLAVSFWTSWKKNPWVFFFFEKKKKKNSTCRNTLRTVLPRYWCLLLGGSLQRNKQCSEEVTTSHEICVKTFLSPHMKEDKIRRVTSKVGRICLQILGIWHPLIAFLKQQCSCKKKTWPTMPPEVENGQNWSWLFGQNDEIWNQEVIPGE